MILRDQYGRIYVTIKIGQHSILALFFSDLCRTTIYLPSLLTHSFHTCSLTPRLSGHIPFARPRARVPCRRLFSRRCILP